MRQKSERVRIMGVLNVTSDSFSDGGKYFDAEHAVRHALEMVERGVDILDIGGESSRPGASGVSAEEEMDRVVPVIKAVKDSVGVPISIDTVKSEVAKEALRAGAEIVNDITALNGDKDMASVIAEADAGVVLMHMKGTPGTMQEDPRYCDVMAEIITRLKEAITAAIDAGIDPEKIIVDPGIGFGKTVEHNLEILRKLGELKCLGKPILVGTSRKSFIGELTGKAANKRMFGTAASVAVSVLMGADIVRVHDIDEMKDVVRVAEAIKRR